MGKTKEKNQIQLIKYNTCKEVDKNFGVYFLLPIDKTLSQELS